MGGDKGLTYQQQHSKRGSGKECLFIYFFIHCFFFAYTPRIWICICSEAQGFESPTSVEWDAMIELDQKTPCNSFAPPCTALANLHLMEFVDSISAFKWFRLFFTSFPISFLPCYSLRDIHWCQPSVASLLRKHDCNGYTVFVREIYCLFL